MKKLAFALVVVLVLGMFSGCEEKTQKYTDYTFQYFDTVTTIIGYEKDNQTFKENCIKIKNQLEQYHKLYDIYNSYEGINNLYTVNSHTEVKVEKEIIDLLEFCCDMYSATNGKLNIAMGSVLKIWSSYRAEGKTLPPMEQLIKSNEYTNIEDIIINKDKSTVYLADNEMFLDVGAVGKGYAVWRISQWMKENGFERYILNVGGNVSTIGGKDWEVAIENPDDTETYAEIIKLDGGMSLVTSGSYQRFYTVDGKNYHHIIDTETLMPSNYFKSVSVLCENSALADALSTALFCMSYEEGLKILENFQNTEVMWIKNNGQKLYTKGLKKSS